MTYASQIARAFLEGKFICKVSYPEYWNALHEPEVMSEVESILMGTNLQLAITGQNHAYYMIESDHAANRKQLETDGKDLGKETMRMEEFTLFMMEIFNDQPLFVGQTFSASDIMNEIGKSEDLANKFDRLALMDGNKSSTLAIRNSKLLSKLCNDGYLFELDKSKEVYRVTGKLDYIMDAMDRIVPHFPEIVDRMAQAELDIEPRQGEFNL